MAPMATSRREFLLSTTALFAAAGCGFGQSTNSGVENIGAAGARAKQTLDGELSLAVPQHALPRRIVSDFHDESGVRVRIQRVGTDEELLLGIGAGAAGFLDAVLVGDRVLKQLIDLNLVESLDRSLITGQDGISSPYNDPPIDGGMQHAIPQDLTPVGFAVLDAAPIRQDSWRGLFRLAVDYPGRVDVPNDAATVIGAVLVSLGHQWNSDDGGDLDEAAAELARVRPALIVRASPRPVAASGAMAALGAGSTYRGVPAPVRFVVPVEGTAVRVRSWCIPILAPHPVSAHAWLANAITPTAAASWSLDLGLATPVEAVRSELPAALTDDPAVYPPAAAIPNIVYEDISADGLARREQIWSQVTG
jgi:spermidine/putrescine transport system substrate-binding protein